MELLLGFFCCMLLPFVTIIVLRTLNGGNAIGVPKNLDTTKKD